MQDTFRKKQQGLSFEGRGASTNKLLHIAYHYVISPPPLDAAELKPMRIFEHELLGGTGVAFVAILMLAAALALFLFRFLMPRSIRVPAGRMARMLKLTDMGHVLVWGVMLPIGLYLIITRFTPLGGRSYGIMHFNFTFPGVHLIALCLALLVVPTMVMSCRLSRRLAPYGFEQGSIAPSIALALLLLLPSLAAYPVLIRFGPSIWTLSALTIPFVLVLCIVLVIILRRLFGIISDRLLMTGTAIAVLPAYAITIIALGLLVWNHQFAEKYWLTRDTFTRINPDAPDLGAYEFKIAAQKRREINAMMGYE
jgi:hypothetical protein